MVFVVVQVLEVHSTAGSLDTSYVVNGSAKAWVNFNGTGTIAIRDSFSVSSLDDDATGRYSYNISAAMSDANYNCMSNCCQSGIATPDRCAASLPENSSSVIIGSRNTSNADVDTEQVHGGIHGDLA